MDILRFTFSYILVGMHLIHIHFSSTPYTILYYGELLSCIMAQITRQILRDEQRKVRKAAILSHAYGKKSSANSAEQQLVKVKELHAGVRISRLEVLVLRRYPRRQVHSANYRGPVAAACGRDETGVIGLVLWGEQVDRVRTGDVIRISNGWCRRTHGELVVSSGRTGQLSVIPS